MGKNLDKMIKIDFYSGSIDEAVSELIKYRQLGVDAFIDFNGHILYSSDVNLNKAYIEITGMSKEEYDLYLKKASEDAHKRLEEKKKQAIFNILPNIEEGQKNIYPEYHDDWKKLVVDDADGLYSGGIASWTLELMDAYNHGASHSEVVEIFNGQGHSGISAGLVRDTMFYYAVDGPDFWLATSTSVPTMDEIEQLLAKREENRKLEEIHHLRDSRTNDFAEYKLKKNKQKSNI